MALSYGDISTSWTREVYVSNVKVVAILAPVAGSSNGSPILVQYRLDSDLGINANLNGLDGDGKCTYVQYSTDSGSTWHNCSIDTTNPLHSGLTGLAVTSATQDFYFAWDSAADLTTAFQSSTIRIQVKASDGSVDCPFVSTSDLQIDMLPDAPTLISPPTQYFDRDTTPDFIFQIPQDPGSDRIGFRIEVDDSSDFSSPILDKNSYDDWASLAFSYRTTAPITPAVKNGANSQTYIVQGLSVTSFTGTTTTFASLTDTHKDTAIPTTLVNPQILLINKSDRRCFIDPATITGTQFVITKSSVGISTNGLVDLIIYSGATVDFESYWVDIAALAGTTAYTLGVAPFDIDLLGRSVPASITNLMPMILEGNDRGVYLSAVSDSGFSISLSGAGVATTAKIRICLFSPANEAYQDRTVSSAAWTTSTNLDFGSALNDETGGAASWPDFLPGAILVSSSLADRMVYINPMDDSVEVQASGVGIATTAALNLRAWGEADASIAPSYWSPVPRSGVSDFYENGYARYRVPAGLELATGTWHWRVRAFNVS